MTGELGVLLIECAAWHRATVADDLGLRKRLAASLGAGGLHQATGPR